MKKLFLLFVLLIAVNGCKKDEPEPKPEEKLKVIEQVEVSNVNINNSNASNYTLITSTQTATLDQELNVETDTPYSQLKDQNNNLVALTYYNYGNDDIILSPKETAIALAIDEFEFFVDLDVFTEQQATDLKNAFYNFDGVQQLESKITQVLAQNGYIPENSLTTELDYLRQKFRDLDLFTNTVSSRPANRSVNSVTPSDFTFTSSDYRLNNITINSVSQSANNSYDLSLKIGNASRLVLGIVRGQKNSGNYIPNGTDYQYLFTKDYEFSFDNIVNMLNGSGVDLETQITDPINININNAYNQLVVVPPALDNTGKIYGVNVICYLLKAVVATVEFYDIEPTSASTNTIREFYAKVKEDAIENITHRLIVESPQLIQSAQNISGTSIPEVLSLFNELIVNDIVKEEIYNAIVDNYATFGGSATLPLTLDQVQTQLEDRFPVWKKATIAGTFVGNFLASMTENIFTNENIGIDVGITPGAAIFPEKAHNFQTYYYFDNSNPNSYDLKLSWDAVDPETGTVLNDVYYSDVNVLSLNLLASDVSQNEYLFSNLANGNNYYYRIDTKDGINITQGDPDVLPAFGQDPTITGTVNNTATTDIVTEATNYVFEWNEIDNNANETYNFTLYDSNDNVLETHNNLTTNTITLNNIHNYSYILKWKVEIFSDNYEIKSNVFDLFINSPLPTLTTTAVTAITSTTATGGGNVVNDGGSSVTARGVCYGTNPNPTTADFTTSDGTGTGSFTSSLTGLQPNTTYYVRAYATNSTGTAYGNEEQFTTFANTTTIPTLTTTAISNITTNSATGGGNITDDGGSSITARGVCYGTSPNPTTADFTTSDGTGTGSFTSSLTGLQPNTTYYVRAYATNTVGTAYGNEEQFTTNSGGTSTFPGQTVLVSGGTFMMGSQIGIGYSNEHPQHSVTVSSFRISKYEITNQQYADFMNAINANADGSVAGVEYLDMDDPEIQISHNGSSFIVNAGKENYPVIEVSWDGAKAYCDYYGGRLPTEAEWEFTARGGNSSNGYTYSGSNNIDDVAWYYDNSGSATHTVGTKNANELGIYDMSGNVKEWCNDWYSNNYYSNSPSNNPQGSSSGTDRVYRGGDYYDYDDGCRIAFRGFDYPFGSSDGLGFRPVFVP